MSQDVAVAPVEDCFRHVAGPRGIYAAIERIDIDSGLLAVAGEAGLIASEEAANEIHVRVIVEADAKNCETLRGELFLQLDEEGKFVAAGFTPRGPEGDDERLAAIFRESLLIAREIDEREIGCGGLGGY